MKLFFRKFSIAPQGLRYKLLIAFTLMSIIPMLVAVYIINSYLANRDSFQLTATSFMALIAVALSWAGLLLAKNLVEPIIDMSIEAKMIADGNYDRRIAIRSEDELGELGKSINLFIQRLKNNMNELRNYGEKTKEINLEVQKKMVTLMDLFHINDLISESADISRIIDVILDKMSRFYENSFSIIYMPENLNDEFVAKGYVNIHDSELLNKHIKAGEGFLGEIASRKKAVILDNSNPVGSKEAAFKSKYKLDNLVIIPVFTGMHIRGVLLTGNYMKEFTYTNEDIDILKIFGQQLSIAVENNLLSKKAEDLSLKDDLTGLYNASYLKVRLREEIERATIYQRPCSLMLIDIDDFCQYEVNKGHMATENVLKKIANIIRHNIVEPVDKPARLGDDSFAVILPEKNKKQAINLAETLRNEMEKFRFSNADDDKITVSIGVSENPLDGATGSQLQQKALEYLQNAKDEGKNKVKS